MARRKPSGNSAKSGTDGESSLPSSNPVTTLVIADIVLRGAGSLLRQKLEKGLITGQLDGDKARRMVENRSMVSSLALLGASRLATRSPVGLAVVAGGLAAKVLYDRGKHVQAKRRARKSAAAPAADSES
ncbi:MAG: hypothetical protein RIT17_569 [Pseudomonadota bacterium]|jgi:hypothetical protein